MKEGQVYNRADIVNFMGLDINATTFQRMKGFTDNGKSMNSTTYDRRYVDEKTERSDTIAYATAIAYSFDRMYGNVVHNIITKIHDDELTGEIVPIVTVNFNEDIKLNLDCGLLLLKVMEIQQTLILIVVHLRQMVQ